MTSQSLVKRIEKLEDKIPPELGFEWMRIVVDVGQTKDDAVKEWMLDNDKSKPPENVIYRVLV